MAMNVAEPGAVRPPADTARPSPPPDDAVALIVDARGTRCPMPITMLSQAMTTASGTLLELLADDPNARVDVPVWCRLKRHTLMDVSESGGCWHFVVRVR